MPWLPVVETIGTERFLTDEPNDLYRNGNFSNVNVLTGVTADEFISPVACKLHNSFNFFSFIKTNFHNSNSRKLQLDEAFERKF